MMKVCYYFGHMSAEHMDKADVAHLATLTQLELSDEQAEEMVGAFSDILGYVSTLKEIPLEDRADEVGEVHTVLREDTDPHEPGAYTERLLNEAPKERNGYVEVKKILQQD